MGSPMAKYAFQHIPLNNGMTIKALTQTKAFIRWTQAEVGLDLEDFRAALCDVIRAEHGIEVESDVIDEIVARAFACRPRLMKREGLFGKTYRLTDEGMRIRQQQVFLNMLHGTVYDKMDKVREREVHGVSYATQRKRESRRGNANRVIEGEIV